MPSTSDYTIRLFKFSVRNGNGMVFLLDAKTGAELSDKAFTENGFRLDFAKSHYLKVFVKKDIISGEEIIDTRENKPAKDGATYTDEGIYTITVEDPSTEQITKKKIYVGTDDRYKAYVTTGLSLKEIDAKIAAGESIGDDGNFVDASAAEGDNQLAETASSEQKSFGSPVVPIIIIVLIAVIVIALSRRHNKKKASVKDDQEGRNK